jgi:hypothetical protein
VVYWGRSRVEVRWVWGVGGVVRSVHWVLALRSAPVLRAGGDRVERAIGTMPVGTCEVSTWGVVASVFDRDERPQSVGLELSLSSTEGTVAFA